MVVFSRIASRNPFAYRSLTRSLQPRCFSKLVGIDLGTTNSCVAYMPAGASNPEVIENEDGAFTTPSVVAFTDSDVRLVGIPARRQAVTNPKNTFHATKRLIGRSASDPETKKDAAHLPYKVVSGSNGDAWVETTKGQKFSPSQIGAIILGKMKQIAETHIGEEVPNAVITVPAYFNDSQRQATKDAGTIAGFNVDRVINEPTAAALAYGLNRNRDDGIIAVYDLGGGTFDVSILSLERGVFQVLATNGNTSLGGEDFDNVLIETILSTYKSETGEDLSKNQTALQRVKEAAETSKMQLDNFSSTEVNLPFISGTKHLSQTLSRQRFENLVESLLDRTMEPCETAMKDADVSKAELRDVILVGGQTRMPKVKERVKQIFGREPSSSVNPDQVVAMGASIQGGILAGSVKDVLLVDVTPLSLGIQLRGDEFSIIIPKNTPIPVAKSKSYTTSEDNQSSIKTSVFQGERPMASDNKLLGEFMFTGIPPAKRGSPSIDVTFDIDANGIVHVTAEDKKLGLKNDIIIHSSSGLSQAEIERMRKDAEMHAESDKQKMAAQEESNKLDTNIYQAENSLSEFAKQIPPELRLEIEQKVDAAKSARFAKDPDEMKKASEELQLSIQKIGEAIYSQGGKSSEQNKDKEN